MGELSEYIDAAVPPSGKGCVDCDAVGSWWMHLRRCALCGHVGCCDDSLLKHGTAHFEATGHRLMQSFEPGEDWYWDFVGENTLDGPKLAAPDAHPEDQSVPGPADRLPEHWEQLLGA